MMKDFAMHVLDIAQNSISAGAKLIELEIIEDTEKNIFCFTIRDDGCGMDAEMVNQVRSPFTTSRTTRKVGLGIPMLDQTCQLCGGSLAIESEPGKGTKLCALMRLDSIDLPPLGDIADIVHMLIVTNEALDFVYTHALGENHFSLDTHEIKQVLEGVPLSEPSVMGWLKETIAEGLAGLKK